jgi:hypothetical protein
MSKATVAFAGIPACAVIGTDIIFAISPFLIVNPDGEVNRAADRRGGVLLEAIQRVDDRLKLRRHIATARLQTRDRTDAHREDAGVIRVPGAIRSPIAPSNILSTPPHTSPKLPLGHWIPGA